MCHSLGVMKPLALFFCALVPMSALASSACSDGMSDDPAQGSGDAAAGRPHLAKPIIVEAACPIVIDSPPLLDSPHVAIDTPVTYNSNPPSSGPHYPIWAAFQEFEKPVDRRYTVHDLEHGAVVVSYNCQAKGAGDCAAILAGLRAAIAGGEIAPGTIVLLRTGYDSRWPDRKAYFGDDTPKSGVAANSCYDLPDRKSTRLNSSH